ncbi:MAG: hypothetical protein ACHQX3_12305, partial [Nitrospirales bacterium]
MRAKTLESWLYSSQRRLAILRKLDQPLTATQLARKAGIDRDSCSELLGELYLKAFVTCLNPKQQRSRVYWLTGRGLHFRSRLTQEPIEPLPEIEWALYGELCHNHRSAIMRAIREPMRPSKIKRRALLADAELRINLNNVRDILRWMLRKNLVQHVHLRKYVHPLYELTGTGKAMQQLLARA